LIAGISVRTALYSFHVWLPEAHASALIPVSAMLSGLVIKISFLSIWRFSMFLKCLRFAIFRLGGSRYSSDCRILGFMQTRLQKTSGLAFISQMGYIITAFGAVMRLLLSPHCTI
jgi:multicomponent Na+:H+ antiporter subunit D